MLAGFGGSAVLTGRIAHLLIGDVKTLSGEALAGTLSQTFLWFGMAFTVLLVLLALTFRFPAPGWRPQGWVTATGSTASISFDRAAMVRTSTFWGLFLCYVIGSLSGLMAIGISKPVGSEIVHVSSAAGSALVGLFALFNALGRPLFGWLADRITPRWAAVLNLAILLSVSVAMLRAGADTVPLYVASFAGFWLCLGGWLAIAPAATASYFGMAHYSRNYGGVFLAYGLGAILGGLLSGQAKDFFGSYVYAFYPTAGLAALGIVIALVLLKPPARRN
jgi:hypothetical protein